MTIQYGACALHAGHARLHKRKNMHTHSGNHTHTHTRTHAHVPTRAHTRREICNTYCFSIATMIRQSASVFVIHALPVLYYCR